MIGSDSERFARAGQKAPESHQIMYATTIIDWKLQIIYATTSAS